MPITPTNPFKGRHFPGEVILLCVRWYLRYPAGLRTRRRTFGGTRRGSGPQLHLALGAGLCTGAEQALPPTSEADQQKLPHGRDLYKGEGRRPSGITSKPAIEGHFKTGQRTITLDELVLPYRLARWQVQFDPSVLSSALSRLSCRSARPDSSLPLPCAGS